MAVIGLALGLAWADPYVACQGGDGAACWSLVDVVPEHARRDFVTRSCTLGVRDACARDDGDAAAMAMALCQQGDEDACWRAVSRAPSDEKLAQACASGWGDACPGGSLLGAGAVVQGVVTVPESALAPIRGGVLVVSATGPRRLGTWTPSGGITWGVVLTTAEVTVRASPWGEELSLAFGGPRPAFASARGMSATSEGRLPARVAWPFRLKGGQLEALADDGAVRWSVPSTASGVATVSPDGRVVVLHEQAGLVFHDAADGRRLQRSLRRCDGVWWTDEGHLLCTRAREPSVLLQMGAGAAKTPAVRVNRVVGERWPEPTPPPRPDPPAPDPPVRVLDAMGQVIEARLEAWHPCNQRGSSHIVEGVCPTDLVRVQVEGEGVVIAKHGHTRVLPSGEPPHYLPPGGWDLWLVSSGGVTPTTRRLDREPVVLTIPAGEVPPPLRVVDARGEPAPRTLVEVKVGGHPAQKATSDYAGFVQLPALQVPGASVRGYGVVDGVLWPTPSPNLWARHADATPAGVVATTSVGELRSGDLILSVCGHDVEERGLADAAAATARPNDTPCTVEVWRRLERVVLPLPAELAP